MEAVPQEDAKSGTYKIKERGGGSPTGRRQEWHTQGTRCWRPRRKTPRVAQTRNEVLAAPQEDVKSGTDKERGGGSPTGRRQEWHRQGTRWWQSHRKTPRVAQPSNNFIENGAQNYKGSFSRNIPLRPRHCGCRGKSMNFTGCCNRDGGTNEEEGNKWATAGGGGHQVGGHHI